jgi:hypothetical protein
MNWAYIAGFFDGEGSICFSRRSGSAKNTAMWGVPTVQIVQCGDGGKSVLEEIRQFLESKEINGRVDFDAAHLEQKENQPIRRRKAKYRLSVQSRQGVLAFLRGVMPYTRVKRVLSQDVLRFLTLCPSLQGRMRGNKACLSTKFKYESMFGGVKCQKIA